MFKILLIIITIVEGGLQKMLVCCYSTPTKMIWTLDVDYLGFGESSSRNYFLHIFIISHILLIYLFSAELLRYFCKGCMLSVASKQTKIIFIGCDANKSKGSFE